MKTKLSVIVVAMLSLAAVPANQPTTAVLTSSLNNWLYIAQVDQELFAGAGLSEAAAYFQGRADAFNLVLNQGTTTTPVAGQTVTARTSASSRAQPQ